MKKKIYVLYFGYNQYDQLGDYAVGFFSEMPDFQTLKKFCEEYKGEFCTPSVSWLSQDACYGKLIRGEVVTGIQNGGGNSWQIVEEALC